MKDDPNSEKPLLTLDDYLKKWGSSLKDCAPIRLFVISIIFMIGPELYELIREYDHYRTYNQIDAWVTQHKHKKGKVCVHYTYKVNEKLYTATSIWYGEEKLKTARRRTHRFIFFKVVLKKSAQTIINEYPVGSHIKIYVHAKDPDDTEFDRPFMNFINRGHLKVDYACILITLLVFLILTINHRLNRQQ